MKNFMATAIALTFMTTSVNAGTLTVQYPQNACHEIMSQEYSTGGGDSAFQFLEILCRDENGKYKGFMLRMKSVGGFLGMGRLVTPETIIYEPYSGSVLKRK